MQNPDVETSGTGNAFTVRHFHDCETCGGVGSLERASHNRYASVYRETRCDACEGGMVSDDRCGCDDCTDAAMDHAAACGCGTCWACDVLRGNQHGPMTLDQWVRAKALDLHLEEDLAESVASFADEAVASC